MSTILILLAAALVIVILLRLYHGPDSSTTAPRTGDLHAGDTAAGSSGESFDCGSTGSCDGGGSGD